MLYKREFLIPAAFKFFLFFICVSSGLYLPAINAYAQKNPGALKSSAEFIDAIKYYRYLNPDSAIIFVKAGIKKSIKDADELGQAALLNQYGMIDDNAARYQESRQKYLQAEVIYRRAKNEEGLASTLVRLGVVEKRKGNFNNALSYYMEALRLSEKNNHELGKLEARVVLAEAYYSLNDFENCLKNLQLAEKIDGQIPSSNFSLNMYITYGYFFIKINKYNKAIEYIEKGLSKADKVEYNGSKIGLLNLLGNAYNSKGDEVKAVASFQIALSFAREIKNILREQATLIELAEVYERSSPRTALKYLGEALIIVNQHKMYRQEITVLNKMSELHKRMANFEKALTLYERSYAISEEVYYKDMSKQISNLETAYELEKSNAELSALQLTNNKATMMKNIVEGIAVGVTLLFAITFVYYYRAKDLNKLLQQANDRLAESNEEKDRFFSIMAHDIRSPLASTISVLRLIADRELDEETQTVVVNKLTVHCQSSLEVLDKLLKWGQMQIKGAKINITEFKPLQNVNQNIAFLQDAAEQKNIDITVNVPDDIVLKADSNHFDFVVRNLLANAIKFTPTNGMITLSAKLLHANVAQFTVADNGVGISEKRLQNLFKLSSIGTKGTSSEEGTSLGLLICKEFIMANSGEIKVESEIGKGTIFTFTLPAFAALDV